MNYASAVETYLNCSVIVAAYEYARDRHGVSRRTAEHAATVLNVLRGVFPVFATCAIVQDRFQDDGYEVSDRGRWIAVEDLVEAREVLAEALADTDPCAEHERVERPPTGIALTGVVDSWELVRWPPTPHPILGHNPRHGADELTMTIRLTDMRTIGEGLRDCMRRRVRVLIEPEE